VGALSFVPSEEIMATLNVKNFPDHIYRRLQIRARQNRRSVSQEVVHLLEKAVAESPRLSLLELEGLGKELWEKALATKDAAQFISDERDSWS
jgi:plasmid stability protein